MENQKFPPRRQPRPQQKTLRYGPVTQYGSAFLHVSKHIKFIWGNRAKFRKNGHIPMLGYDSLQ